MYKLKRIRSQFMNLLQRNLRTFFSFKGTDLFRILIIFGGPILIAYAVSWTIGGGFSNDASMNLCALLVIVISIIYIGIFNSILVVCNEKQILKYEFIAGISPTAYILSVTVVQFGICFIQAVLFTSVYMGTLDIPEMSFLLGKCINWFITIFLILFSSDMVGLCLSSIAPNGEIANVLSPVCIIVQILFSGILWKLEGFVQNCTVARWGLIGLGAQIKIGTVRIFSGDKQELFEMQLERMGYSLEEINSYIVGSVPFDLSQFESTSANVISAWLGLLSIAFVCLLVAVIMVRIVKWRKRS